MTKLEEECISTSCFNKAKPDEMLFVLLARDIAAPSTIRFWCDERIRLGKNKGYDDEQITEALKCAKEMEIQFSATKPLETKESSTLQIGGHVFNKNTILSYHCICTNGNQDLGVEITSIADHRIQLPYVGFTDFDKAFKGLD